MPRLLPSKLRPAPVPAFAVDRGRLLRRLDAGMRHRLVLLSVPAGHGKSVLLAQWVAARADGVAWLTIDARDVDPVRMARHLGAAFTHVGIDLGDDVVRHLPPGTGSLGDAFVDTVLTEIDAFGDDVVFVLEDLDRVEDSPLVGDLGRMINDAPPNAHFVVACRADPSFSTQRLRVQGEITDLRVDDLRFTMEEARTLLDRLSGRSLTDDQIALLLARTEGWPVAVQLAALSLRSVEDPGEFIDQFSGDDRNVADFLSSELLSNEPEEARQFLLDISVLENVHPDLCNVMIGRDDSEQLLEALEHRGLFLTRVEPHGKWYRYHRLVREFLLHDLGRSDPGRSRELLIGAANWCTERKEILHAAGYLVDAAAWEELANLIWTHARDLWDAGFAETVLAWIESMPAAVVREDNRLRLAHSALNALVGRASVARSMVDDLEAEGRLSDAEQLLADGIVVGLVEHTEPPEQVVGRADRALASLPATDTSELPDIFGLSTPGSMECFFALNAARAHLLVGHARQAFEYSQRAVRSPGTARPGWQVHALGTQALLDALAGRLNAAEGEAKRALEVAHVHLGTGHLATITPQLALALVARARNDNERARAILDETIERARRWRRWPWVGLGLAELASLETVRGRPEESLRLLRDFAKMPVPRPAPFLEARLRAAEARALDAIGERDAAVRFLDTDWLRTDSVELALTRLFFAATSNDTRRVQKELDRWPAQCTPFGAIEHDLWRAIELSLDGRRRDALDIVAAVMATAQREGHVRMFLDAGPEAIRLVRELLRAQARPHGRKVLDAAAERPTRKVATDLVEQLSTRELGVLRYLPTRMTYAEIASEMFISTNTLKTHVRHICQKLGVAGRDAAVDNAERLGLL